MINATSNKGEHNFGNSGSGRAGRCTFALDSSDQVGRLIGRGGETVKSICGDSGTYITFSRESQLGTICGNVDSISKAFGLITLELGKVDSHVSVAIIVPQSQVGKIVGRKGAVVKKLEEESGGRISIQKLGPGETGQRVKLSGSPEAVSTIASYIVGAVDFDAQESQYPYMGRGGEKMSSPFSPRREHDRSRNRIHNTSGILECPISLHDADHVSKIIGKSGAVIKRICQDSSTRISFTNVTGILTGRKDNILKAIRLIVTELGTTKEIVAISILTPKAEIPKIIGKGGTTVKKFEASSGAGISIGDGTVLQPVKITGAVEQVCMAVEFVFTCIDYFDITGLVQKAFTRKKIADSSDEFEMQVKIALTEESVSAIIDKGGSGVRLIARSSGVNVSFQKDLYYQEGTETGTIVGSIDGVCHALNLLIQRIEVDQGLSLIVPTSIIGWVIGEGGSRIEETMVMSGAKINIGEEPCNVAGIEEKLISVTGNVPSITLAIESLVRQIGQIGKISETDSTVVEDA